VPPSPGCREPCAFLVKRRRLRSQTALCQRYGCEGGTGLLRKKGDRRVEEWIGGGSTESFQSVRSIKLNLLAGETEDAGKEGAIRQGGCKKRKSRGRRLRHCGCCDLDGKRNPKDRRLDAVCLLGRGRTSNLCLLSAIGEKRGYPCAESRQEG